MKTERNSFMDGLSEQITDKIESLAYRKAELRGLEETGHEIEDWLQAEEEVLSSLRGE
jgi:hypothetical protein